jgi:hypothetical protein
MSVVSNQVYGGGFKTRSRSAVTSPVDIVQPARLSTSPPIPEHGTVSFAEGFPTTAPGASPDDHAPGNKGLWLKSIVPVFATEVSSHAVC